MTTGLTLCNFGAAKWLIFSPNVPPLIYYSHLSNIIISLFIGIFVLIQTRWSLPSKILFFTILAFVTWVFAALIFWATNRSDVVMFMWLMDILVEPLVYIGCLYLLHVLIDKKDIPFYWKVILGLIYAPLAILLPTNFTLSGFDVSSCLAIESFMALYYSYFVEITVTVWIIVFAIKKYITIQDSQLKKQVLYLTTGVLFLLLAFAWGNITGSFTDDWALGDCGLFGMPIFLGFLAYSIVRFRLFNLKLIGANVLVVTLWLATASLLTIQDISTSHAIVAGTLILTTFFGWFLIRSVEKEVTQREQIEVLAKNLEVANDGQKQFIHYLNHESKGYLTDDNVILASIIDADYGPGAPELVKMATTVLRRNKRAADDIDEMILGADLSSGSVRYTMESFDLKKELNVFVDEYCPDATEKDQKLEFQPEDGDFTIVGDKRRLLRHALKNYLRNAIVYTPVGGTIVVGLVHKDNKVQIFVKDSGVGISNEDKGRLFTEGGKGLHSTDMNPNSTGRGLYIVKQIAEAHGGRVWVESAGAGKGSTFFLEIPIKQG